jgi:hypothetical protein
MLTKIPFDLSETKMNQVRTWQHKCIMGAIVECIRGCGFDEQEMGVELEINDKIKVRISKEPFVVELTSRNNNEEDLWLLREKLTDLVFGLVTERENMCFKMLI